MLVSAILVLSVTLVSAADISLCEFISASAVARTVLPIVLLILS